MQRPEAGNEVAHRAKDEYQLFGAGVRPLEQDTIFAG
jgi:hypothetical protein